MNRAIIGVGAGIFVLAIAFIAYPIAVTGQEQFDLEQEAGLYLIPPALAVALVGAISDDPRVTTIGGAFGNPDLEPRRPPPRRGPIDAGVPLAYHPNEAVACRYCSTVIAPDLAQCPRCARARPCRTCGRPLGIVLERATCPACARPEPFCSCPRLPARPAPSAARARRV
ncbi:MAG TPA: hypothetical protein VMC82_03165 [Thermoplasmata archaeon]|nr:hypothetical protein [Thermoplasmata archaeon]